MKQAAESASALTGALAQQDEYALLRLLTAAAADKDVLRRTLELLDMQLRDAAVLSLNGAFGRLGCDSSAAHQLAPNLTPTRTAAMHNAIAEALADLDGNVGAPLAVTALCAALAEA